MKQGAVCVRCGGSQNMETDRIVSGVEGGKYEPDNERDLCQGCHKYRHARDSLTFAISHYAKQISRYEAIVPDDKYGKQKERGYKRILKRLPLYVRRLSVLEKQNKPELVRSFGYTSYWTDESTH